MMVNKEETISEELLCLFVTLNHELPLDYFRLVQNLNPKIKMLQVNSLDKLEEYLSNHANMLVVYDLTTMESEGLESSQLEKTPLWVLVENVFIDQTHHLFSYPVNNVLNINKPHTFAHSLSQFVEATSKQSLQLDFASSKTQFILNTFNTIATDVIWSKDLNGNYNYINEAGAKFLGAPVEQIIGQDDKSFFLPETYKRVRASDIFVIDTLEVNEVEFTLDSIHGEKQRFFMAMKAPCFDDQNQVIGLIGIIRDITDKKRLETELIEAKIQAEEANQKKSEFLSSITHELRTPLSSIITSSNVMAEGITGELSQKQQAYVKRIHESGIHVLSLIDELLDIAKIESGKYFLEFEESKISTTIEQACHLVEPLICQKDQHFNLYLDEDLPVMYMDSLKIKQAVCNLLSNANKFSPEDSNITLSGYTTPDNTVIITVADEGSGIPEADLERIFLPFEQSKSQNNEYISGTGLGLPITKKIIEYHHGDISVESKVGLGTTFTISLPIIRDVQKLSEEYHSRLKTLEMVEHGKNSDY